MHRSHLVDRKTDLWVCVRPASCEEERQSDRLAAGNDDDGEDNDDDWDDEYNHNES